MPATTVLTGKALTLKFGTAEYHQQTTAAQIVGEDVTETVSPLGVDPVNLRTGTQWTLNLTALQDWPEPASLCDLLADAADAGTPITFELAVVNAAGAKATMTGSCQGAYLPFGGEAGVLSGDVALPIVSGPVRTTTPAPPADAYGAEA